MSLCSEKKFLWKFLGVRKASGDNLPKISFHRGIDSPSSGYRQMAYLGAHGAALLGLRPTTPHRIADVCHMCVARI